MAPEHDRKKFKNKVLNFFRKPNNQDRLQMQEFGFKDTVFCWDILQRWWF